MAATPFFISLIPVNSTFAPQSVAISDFDNVRFLLGGTRPTYSYSPSAPHHTADFLFDDCNIHHDFASISYVDGVISLSSHGDEYKVRVNDTTLIGKETK
ncbi:hypothetical protein A4X13_0g9676 [Tilletia indica]|uniref:Uncharacterized protein n=1 Tax=Tilletia indica TaxID=43049 RepID=A0A177TQU8_9BASI|nr:hypothetical protein A4X13_0g9676 [Tilletia indica]